MMKEAKKILDDIEEIRERREKTSKEVDDKIVSLNDRVQKIKDKRAAKKK